MTPHQPWPFGAVLAGALLASACYEDVDRTRALLARASFARIEGPTTGGAVLDVGAAGEWMAQSVGAPTVIFEDGRYRMWFDAGPEPPRGESPYLFRTAIGAAESDDGVQWRLLNGGLPVFTAGPAGSFDQYSVGQPYVIRRGGQYLMWYGGADGTQAPSGVRVERIGLATSVDGVSWMRANGGAPVIDIGGPGARDTIQATGPCIATTADGLVMWYSAYDGRHTIAVARSRDGVNWTKGSTSGLAPDEALGPSVFRHGRDFLMLYSIPIDDRWTLVAAGSSDGANWTLLNGGRALLPAAPPGSFDAAGAGQNASVHPSQLVVDGAHARLWYMGEDPAPPHRQRIGLLEAPRPLASALADFTGDGSPDLLWQDDADGWIAAWAMNGTTLISSDLLSPARVADTRWKIVGTGDVNGDGKPDIFWQEQTEGWLAVWTMDGTRLVSSELLTPPRVADTHWKVVGILDVNGDMKPDLLWREETEGWVAVWLMNGMTASSSVALDPERVPDTAWTIAGTGDMNGDAQADIIWQHRTEGWLAAWLMDGISVTDSVLLTPARVADTQWRVAGASDIDGDGQMDLIWREESMGWVGAWLMRGTRLVTSVELTPNRVPQRQWRIVGPR